VKIDEQPFAKGSLRLVYHLQVPVTATVTVALRPVYHLQVQVAD
jgi:hypothetical protein